MNVEGASDFQWPSSQAERLFRVFQAGKAGHAYVLNGPAGVGKRTLALLCAQALFCRAEAGRRPCGACPPCLRFAHGNHPDSFVLEAEGSLGVEAVRTLSFALQERAYEAGAKAVRILGADRMTVQAQNALLKTLEEPPGRTVFLLTCEQSTALLPTIRSRCQSVPMPPLPEADAARILAGRGIPPERAALCSRMEGGSVGKALALAQDSQAWALRERVLRAVSLLTAPGRVLDAVQPLREEKEHAPEILNTLEFFARDALRAGLTGQTPEDGPERAVLDRLTQAGAHAQLSLLEALTRGRRQLANHLPWQTVLETLMLTWIEVLQHDQGSRRPVSKSQ